MFTNRRRKKDEDKEKAAKKKSMGKIAHERTEVDGILFDSKMESKYFLYLKELQRKGIVEEFSLQPSFILQEKFINIDGEIILGSDENFEKLKRKYKAKTISAITYISDFAVKYTDGHLEIVDPKGIQTADFILKKKLFQYKYPQFNLRILILDKGEWIDHDVYTKRIRDRKKKNKG